MNFAKSKKKGFLIIIYLKNWIENEVNINYSFFYFISIKNLSDKKQFCQCTNIHYWKF